MGIKYAKRKEGVWGRMRERKWWCRRRRESWYAAEKNSSKKMLSLSFEGQRVDRRSWFPSHLKFPDSSSSLSSHCPFFPILFSASSSSMKQWSRTCSSHSFLSSLLTSSSHHPYPHLLPHRIPGKSKWLSISSKKQGKKRWKCSTPLLYCVWNKKGKRTEVGRKGHTIRPFSSSSFSYSCSTDSFQKSFTRVIWVFPGILPGKRTRGMSSLASHPCSLPGSHVCRSCWWWWGAKRGSDGWCDTKENKHVVY